MPTAVWVAGGLAWPCRLHAAGETIYRQDFDGLAEGRLRDPPRADHDGWGSILTTGGAYGEIVESPEAPGKWLRQRDPAANAAAALQTIHGVPLGYRSSNPRRIALSARFYPASSDLRSRNEFDGYLVEYDVDPSVFLEECEAGELKWRFEAEGAVGTTPSLGADGTVYFGTDGEVLYAVEGATGEPKWRYRVRGGVASAPAIGPDGTVYFSSHDWTLGAVHGRTGISSNTWTPPAAGPIGRRSPKWSCRRASICYLTMRAE
jgi:hypothetical protein